jgi:hypothetical protein
VGVRDWFKGRSKEAPERLEWRRTWADAIGRDDPAAVERLRKALDTMPGSGDDLDVEAEMLDGLEQLVALRGELAAARVPIVETTHRVVGPDPCHFTAPVSLPDDPAQPSGRLLLTSTRAIFVGARLINIPWHATRQAIQIDRDVLLVRATSEDVIRIRCNTYPDALCAAELARHLSAKFHQRKTVARKEGA